MWERRIKGFFPSRLNSSSLKLLFVFPFPGGAQKIFFFLHCCSLAIVNISGFLYNNISLKKINTILHAVQTYIIYEEQIIALEKANCGRGRQKEELVMITYNRANQCTPYRSDMRKYHNSMFSFLSPMAKYVWPNKSVIFLSYTSREHRTFSYT